MVSHVQREQNRFNDSLPEAQSYTAPSTYYETDCHKHLGITLSSSCTWTDHFNIITEKAWVKLNLMRALKFRISRKALEQMYISFIRPLLEYCDSVWDNASTETKQKLNIN